MLKFRGCSRFVQVQRYNMTLGIFHTIPVKVYNLCWMNNLRMKKIKSTFNKIFNTNLLLVFYGKIPMKHKAPTKQIPKPDVHEQKTLNKTQSLTEVSDCHVRSRNQWTISAIHTGLSQLAVLFIEVRAKWSTVKSCGLHIRLVVFQFFWKLSNKLTKGATSNLQL